MSYLLALDCSMAQASLALLENKKNQLELVLESEWKHQALNSPHSDRLPLEIKKLTEKAGISLKKIQALAFGLGPGRFTGVRTALCVAKSLAYSLKLPVYPVNSLKLLAETLEIKPSYVAIQAFQNKIYFGEFDTGKENISLLTFQEWEEKMKKLKENRIISVSDIEDFYKIEKSLKQKIVFKKPRVSAFKLAQIVFKEKVKAHKWFELRAYYLRNPVS